MLFAVSKICRARTGSGAKSAGLLDVNGVLYGTTEDGGTADQGTVFSFDPSSRVQKVVYSFCTQQSCADGDSSSRGADRYERNALRHDVRGRKRFRLQR